MKVVKVAKAENTPFTTFAAFHFMGLKKTQSLSPGFLVVSSPAPDRNPRSGREICDLRADYRYGRATPMPPLLGLIASRGGIVFPCFFFCFPNAKLPR
jgi:hypothetical protein